MKRRLRLYLVIALAALMHAPTPAARADTGPWSSPAPLAGWSTRGGGWFPSIATDLFGDVHVVWNGVLPGMPAPAADPTSARRVTDNAAWLLYTHWDGQRWSTPNEIGAVGYAGDALRAAIAAGPNGRLNLLYRGLDLAAPRNQTGDSDPMRFSSVGPGQGERAAAWDPTVVLSQRLPVYMSDVVVDSRGVLHAVWTEFDSKAGYGVWYRRSTDGGQSWTPAYPIEGDRPVSRWRLQLKLGPKDDLHVVYDIIDGSDFSARQPFGFVYASSRDGGVTWSRQAFLPTITNGLYDKTFQGTAWRQQPAVAVDRRGQIVLVWREFGTNVIYSQRSQDGQTWSNPEPLPGLTRGLERSNLDRYDMAADSDGRVHLVGVGYPRGSTNMALFHLEWSGYRWSDPDLIQAAAGPPYPEWPRIAVGNGNRLHVVWFGGDSDGVDRKPTGIWYSTAQSSAPFVPAAPRPTPAPLAAPRTEPSPTVPLAAPAGPTAVPTSVGPIGTPDQQADQSVDAVLFGLLAALGLIGAGVFLKRSGIVS